jgi:hypothetical protein
MTSYAGAQLDRKPVGRQQPGAERERRLVASGQRIASTLMSTRA